MKRHTLRGAAWMALFPVVGVLILTHTFGPARSARRAPAQVGTEAPAQSREGVRAEAAAGELFRARTRRAAVAHLMVLQYLRIEAFREAMEQAPPRQAASGPGGVDARTLAARLVQIETQQGWLAGARKALASDDPVQATVRSRERRLAEEAQSLEKLLRGKGHSLPGGQASGIADSPPIGKARVLAQSVRRSRLPF